MAQNRPLTTTEAEAMFEATDAAKLARQERERTEPKRFVYLLDGEPKVGTVDDYAHDHDQAHHYGVAIGHTAYIVTSDVSGRMALTEVPITATSSGYDLDDYATMTITVGADEGSYRIDGRA